MGINKEFWLTVLAVPLTSNPSPHHNQEPCYQSSPFLILQYTHALSVLKQWCTEPKDSWKWFLCSGLYVSFIQLEILQLKIVNIKKDYWSNFLEWWELQLIHRKYYFNREWRWEMKKIWTVDPSQKTPQIKTLWTLLHLCIYNVCPAMHIRPVPAMGHVCRSQEHVNIPSQQMGAHVNLMLHVQKSTAYWLLTTSVKIFDGKIESYWFYSWIV